MEQEFANDNKRRSLFSMRKASRFLWIVPILALLHISVSWIASGVLSDHLISADSLGEAENRRESLLASLRANAPVVAEFRHRGSALDPVELFATFASPGDVPERPTLLLLHGKGGNASEWEGDAVRALKLGYNVLLPDLRGHGASGGSFITYGLLEKDDLANALAAARDRFGVDPDKIGLHACSAGCSIALQFAANRGGVQAIWLESPYADSRQMARHYLSVVSGIPPFLLGLTARWAVARSEKRVKRALALDKVKGGAERLDPLRAVARVRAPVLLLYGQNDRLIPPSFAERLGDALPPGSEIWKPAAGHCHYSDEAEKVLAADYARRWQEFFTRHLPVATTR